MHVDLQGLWYDYVDSALRILSNLANAQKPVEKQCLLNVVIMLLRFLDSLRKLSSVQAHW